MDRAGFSFNQKIFMFRKNLPGRIAVLLILVLIGAGCTTLKQWAYEGFDRDAWQFPDRVIGSLDLRPGSAVADLGSGSGYFTFPLAQAVGPGGRVYAVDIDEDMNDLVARRAREKKYENIEVILAEPNDPLLPETGVDLIFTSNAYHHLEDRVKYFANVRKYLRPHARIAVIDFRKGAFQHFTEGEVIKSEMAAAGYRVRQEHDFLPRQHFIVFSQKED